MVQHGNDAAQLIRETANRLRLVQHDLADQEPAVRQRHLEDVLQAALKSPAPSERLAFLKELEKWFPSWDSQVEVTQDTGALAPSDADTRDLTDPSYLVSRLEAVAPSLSESKRQVVRDRLAAAGLVPKAGLQWRQELVQSVNKQLGLPEDAQLDPDRALELLALLAKTAVESNKIVWQTWREISPKNPRGTADLRKTLGRFAAAGQGGEVAPVVKDLETLRGLAAALISGIRGAGSVFAQHLMERLSVPAIEALVELEGAGWGGREVKCWRKYKELVQNLSQESVEREILAAVAEFAGRLLDRGP